MYDYTKNGEILRHSAAVQIERSGSLLVFFHSEKRPSVHLCPPLVISTSGKKINLRPVCSFFSFLPH